MAVFLGLVVALIICQNLLAVGLSHVLHLNPLIGMCTGSIPMVGGHGTAGAFGPVLEDFNIFHGVMTWMNGDIDIAPETMYADSYPYTAQSVSIAVG